MPHFDNSISGYTNDALDASYTKATKSMFEQIIAITTNEGSIMQRALADLDDEARRLEEADEPMGMDNAVLKQTLRVYEESFIAIQNLVAANAKAIQDSGAEIAPGAVTAKVFLEISSELAESGINPVTSPKVFEKVLKERGIKWRILPTT